MIAMLALGAIAKHYPLTLCGIRVGDTTDAQIVRRFGKGRFFADEDHGGGRYYTDATRRWVLHCSLGPDRVIDDVTWGQRLRGDKRAAKAAVARIDAGLETAPGVRLGASANEVTRRWGRPNAVKPDRAGETWTFEADDRSMKNVLFYTATLKFEKDRLVSIELYNGE